MATDSTSDAFGPPVWPSFEQLQAVLEKWSKEHPDLMEVEVPGKSSEGRPVYAVRLTDPQAEEEDKEHVLITALHAGVERNASTTIFSIMEWLLSGEPLAREILRRQVIVCMPVPNPDGYMDGTPGTVYQDWTLEGPKDPENSPEAVAVQKIIDHYQPEVHADIHGISMAFDRYIMLENSGSSYSNSAARCYHREIIQLMEDAALEEGYPSDRLECDSERVFWGPELDSISGKLWRGRPKTSATIYCYNRYHTMLSPGEITWERSGLLRNRRLLQIGNEIWPTEFYPGYPTRVVMSNLYHMVTAYGQTAAARRRSRIELWNKQAQITHGMVDPVVEGKLLYVCATSSKARERWLKDGTLKESVATLKGNARIDGEYIERFVEGWPGGQNAQEAYLQQGESSGKAEQPIDHGLSLRLRIFYPKACIGELRMNGIQVKRGEVDGYVAWVARGQTYVQINIPPERLKTDDLFVVTCEYDPGEKRSHWQGWRLI